MQEVSEVMREISNAKRETEHSLMRLVHFLHQVKRKINKKQHTYTKKDVLNEAKKMFDKFLQDMNLYETKQGQATNENQNDFTDPHENVAEQVNLIESKEEIKKNEQNEEIKSNEVVVLDSIKQSTKKHEFPTLTKFCSDEQILRVDVKNWLLKEGYILDNKTVTDKGKEIGIKEVVTAEHNNKRLVFDEKAQGFLKDHYKDIEKLSGRSVKKEVSRSKDINNADNYLKGVKAIVNNQKGGNQPKDITM